MRPHLMIIDDTVDQVRLMRMIFGMVDPSIEIVTAQDGDEALQLLRRDPKRLPKVILLDLKMPKKSGHEVLSEIKSDPLLKRIPVCTFSVGDSPGDVRESYERGASFYFKKPSGLDELKRFVEHFKGLWYEFASHNG